MSAIPPSQPSEYPPHQETQQDKISNKKRLNEEISVAAVSSFLSGVLKGSGQSADPSKVAKVKQIEQDLKSGSITLDQALNELDTILKELTKGEFGKIPDLRNSKVADPSTLSVDYIRFFQLFLGTTGHDPKTEDLLNKSDQLIDKIESGKIAPKDAIVQLNTLIQKSNESLPESQKFPNIDPSLF